MVKQTAVVTPLYQAEEIIASSAKSTLQLPWMVLDNASSDQTKEILQKTRPNALYQREEKHVSRTENWQRAINFFLEHGHYTWLKWLFAGDRLTNDCEMLILEAQQQFPTAKFFVWDVLEVKGENRKLWTPPTMQKSHLLQPEESTHLAALYGNWFGPPIAHMIHREALEGLPPFGSLSWVADMELSLHIASKYPVAYIHRPIGEFVLGHRRYYQEHHTKPENIFQEALLKCKAAHIYLELTGNKKQFDLLYSTIQFQAAKTLFKRGDFRWGAQIKRKLLNKILLS